MRELLEKSGPPPPTLEPNNTLPRPPFIRLVPLLDVPLLPALRSGVVVVALLLGKKKSQLASQLRPYLLPHLLEVPLDLFELFIAQNKSSSFSAEPAAHTKMGKGGFYVSWLPLAT